VPEVAPGLTLHWVDELAVDAALDAELRPLLAAAFPDFADTFHARRYFKQLPHARLLARQGEALVGHLAVAHRVVGSAAGPQRILGLLDVVVAPERRGMGIAGALLEAAEARGRAAGVDHLVLFADDDRLYGRHGYRPVSSTLRWLRIHEHASLGIAEEPVAELRVRSLGERPWPDGAVDLLGELF
jgi:predicted N-acetyltransferase YhbS